MTGKPPTGVAKETGRRCWRWRRDDGTYVVEFKTGDGEALAISIPRNEAAVIRHFRSACPTAYSCREY